MRDKPLPVAENGRYKVGPLGSAPGQNNGAYRIHSESEGRILCVISSDGGGWDHVSVSVEASRACPTWDEMVQVRRLFFRDDEWVMQLMPPRAENINVHPGCLHMWRPQASEVRVPPSWMVGPKAAADK